MKINNNKALILYIVLWSLVILTVLTVGLGWQAHLELTLSKNYLGKLKSKWAAISGVNYTLDIIKNDAASKELHKPDVFNPHLYKKEIPLGDMSFKINNLSDSLAKINLNSLNSSNYNLMINLLKLKGLDEESATIIACSIIDWIDNDETPFNPPFGAENETYSTLGYKSKNKPFDSIDELLLVRGMNKNVFQKIKEYITIYPINTNFLINLDQASKEVLLSVAQLYTGSLTNTSLEDAQSLVDKIMNYRQSLTDTSLTTQDRMIESNKLGLNPKENAIFLSLQSIRASDSKFIDIDITGTDTRTNARTSIKTTLQKSDFSFKSWSRN